MCCSGTNKWLVGSSAHQNSILVNNVTSMDINNNNNDDDNSHEIDSDLPALSSFFILSGFLVNLGDS